MSELYKVLSGLCETREITGYRMCKDLGIQPSIMTDLKMGRRSGLKADTAAKIANYFNVSVDYLLGNEKSPTAEARGVDDKLLRMIEEAKSGHTAIILGFDGGKAEVREISKEQYEATKILLGDINKEK